MSRRPLGISVSVETSTECEVLEDVDPIEDGLGTPDPTAATSYSTPQSMGRHTFFKDDPEDELPHKPSFVESPNTYDERQSVGSIGSSDGGGGCSGERRGTAYSESKSPLTNIYENEHEASGHDDGGAMKDAADSKSKEEQLYDASECGDEEKVEELIKREGIDLDWNDNWLEATSLVVACENGQNDVVSLLIAAGASICAKDKYGRQPLAIAAENGHTDVFIELLEAKAEFDVPERNGTTPLFKACEQGHSIICRYLVDAGADINRKSKAGRCPLLLAAQNGHADIVDMILESADCIIDNASKSGATPLALAAAGGHKEIVESLKSRGANVNCRDKRGVTPMMAASENGHMKVVFALLSGGADARLVDQDGRGALERAQSSGDEKTINLLGGTAIDRVSPTIGSPKLRRRISTELLMPT